MQQSWNTGFLFGYFLGIASLQAWFNRAAAAAICLNFLSYFLLCFDICGKLKILAQLFVHSNAAGIQ